MRVRVAGLLMLVPIGCSAPLPSYSPAIGSGQGYSESKVGPFVFRVRFHGPPGGVPRSTEDLTFLRSAELTLEKGYRYFMILDRRDEAPARVSDDVCNDRRERDCLIDAAAAPTEALRRERERACKARTRGPARSPPCGNPPIPDFQFLIRMFGERPTADEEERIAQRYAIPREEVFVYDAAHVQRELRRKHDLD